MAAHERDDGGVVADVELHGLDLRTDGGNLPGTLDDGVGDRDPLDVGLAGEIEDGAEAHAARAEDKDRVLSAEC